MIKKLLAIILAGVMAMSIMTGCGSSNSQSNSSTESGPVKVEFWYSGGKTAVHVVQEIIDNFNKSQDDYFVTAVTQASYTETYQKLQAGIAGKAAPDLVLLDASTCEILHDKGLVETLNSYMDADTGFSREDYVPVFFDSGVSENGDIFAMPAYGTTQVLYYNMEAFNKAGVNPDEIDAVIPGNDDAIRAVKLIAETIAAAVIEGRQGSEMGTAANDEAEEVAEAADAE